MVERGVVPVEAAAGLRGRDEQRQDDGAEERLVLARPRPACARAKIRAAGSRAQVFEREPRVLSLCERGRARLEEPAHERPVLVERRPAERLVLLERERKILVDEQRGTRPARSRAASGRGAERAGPRRSLLRGGALSSLTAGHQYAMRAASPSGHERIVAPQRGHGRLLRR